MPFEMPICRRRVGAVARMVLIGWVMALAELSVHGQGQTLQQSMIWSPSFPPGTQVYRAFRKSFSLATNPSQATLQIFADSRYILWINGRYVLRGPCRFDWHAPQYDTVDVTSFLQPGTNVLAVMAHSYDNLTSKIMQHAPGLTVQLQLPGSNIVTDTTWRSGPTIYQPSPNAWGSIPDVIDATVQTNDWTATNFDDSSWEKATAVDGSQWGPLQPRTIPLAIETLMTNVALEPSGQSLTDALPITLNAGDEIIINLGQMALAYAALDLDANANSGLQVTYYLRYVNGQPGETYGVGTTYTARAGRQRFITGDEWGCHYVGIQCTSGRITLYGLNFVQRRYPFTRLGQFNCNEPTLSQLWTNAVHTIELVSDDGYGADARERNEWLQDPAEPNFITTRVADAGSNSDGTLVYSDPRLLKNLMFHDSFTHYQTGDGRLKAHTCSDRWDVHGFIEDYSCQWIESLRLYYDATGDTNFVAEMWPALTNQMAWFQAQMQPDGLMLLREFVIFDNPLAYITCEGATVNAFVYQALKDSAYLGNAIGATGQANNYLQAATNLASAFNQNLWDATAGTYNSAILNGQSLAPSAHAALIALDRGIVPSNRLASVRGYFLANYKNPGTINVASNPNYLTWLQQGVGINMPVTYYWVFNQLYKMDSAAMDIQALNELRRRWSGMVTNRTDTGTITEYFTDVNGGAESCHNYGAVPAWFLSSYVLGVRLEGPVWTNRILIEPRPGDLQFAQGIVLTEHGPVPVSWDQSSGQLLNFSFTVPAGVRATVHLPKTSATNTLVLNGLTLVNQGSLNSNVSTYGRWFVLDLPPGTNRGALTLSPPPPLIQSEPSSGIGFPGETFSFSIAASGQALAYQWQKNSNNIPGATNSILMLTNLSLSDSGYYQVILTNPGGVTNSDIVALQVVSAASNTVYLDHFTGPAGELDDRTPDTVDSGDSVWIADPGWTTDGAEANVNDSTINAFLPFAPSPGEVYRLSADINCVGSDGADWLAIGFADGTNTGAAWQLGNNAVGWMLARDSGTSGSDGQTFIGPNEAGVNETGIYPKGVMNYAVVLDARNANPAEWTFTFLVNSAAVQPTTVFGGSGPAISSVGIGMLAGGGLGYVKNFTLTVEGSAAPVITVQPAGGTFFAGATVSLRVGPLGAPPFSYQWQINSRDIVNATNSTLTLADINASDSGSYNVVVSNSSGSVRSSNAIVTVQPSFLTVIPTLDSGDVYPSIPCLSNDLLQTYLGSVNPPADGNNFTGIYMRNGSTGAAYDGNGGAGPNPANIMASGTNDFFLDTTTEPNGYDIASINTYSGWMGTRAGQDHSVWCQSVGNSNWVFLTNVSIAAADGSLRVAVSQSHGNIASGVQAIRVIVNRTFFVYRELDVVGVPTVLPPAPPTLEIVPAASGFVIVTWRASLAGYTLFTTPTLGPPASWQTVSNQPIMTNGGYQVSLSTAHTQFFRLQK